MNLQKDIWAEFYRQLGSLFYAVAASDKVVHPLEIKTLKELIIREWNTNEVYREHFGADVIFQMETVFHWLEKNESNPQESFKKFREYYLANKSLFTTDRKKLILETASKIARSFSSINKSELIILSKLDQLLKQ